MYVHTNTMLPKFQYDQTCASDLKLVLSYYTFLFIIHRNLSQKLALILILTLRLIKQSQQRIT